MSHIVTIRVTKKEWSMLTKEEIDKIIAAIVEAKEQAGQKVTLVHDITNDQILYDKRDKDKDLN